MSAIGTKRTFSFAPNNVRFPGKNGNRAAPRYAGRQPRGGNAWVIGNLFVGHSGGCRLMSA